MKAFLLKSFGVIYRFLFKEEMSSAVIEFLSHISWSFTGGLISTGVLLVTGILAGRLLGPTEYGKFNFVAAVSQIIFAVILVGFDRASIRFISQAKNQSSQANHLSAALKSVLTTSVFFSILFLFVYRPIAKLFGTESVLLLMALIYGLFYSFRHLFDGFIRGLQKFKLQTLSRIIESAIIFTSFGMFFYFSLTTGYQKYLYALIAGYLIFILISAINLKSYYKPFDWDSFRQQFPFAKVYFLSVVLGALFGSLDKIVIGRYLSFRELGIYGAYYAAATNFTSQLSSVFGNVLAPVFSKNLDRAKVILQKIDRLTLIIFLPLLFLVMGVTALIIFLLGSAYPLTVPYVLSFSLLAVLNMIYSINALITSIYSKKSITMTTLIGNGINIFFAGLFLLLVYNFGLSLQLVIFLLIIYNFVLIFLCKYVLYREGAYLSPPQNECRDR